MVFNRIRQALVLATHRDPAQRPLGLADVGGLPLLKRILLTLRKADVRRIAVVAEGSVAEAFAGDRDLAHLDLQWIRVQGPCPERDALLAARGALRGDFFLVQGDRVFDPAILNRLQEEPLDGVTLAVDGGPRGDPSALSVIASPDRHLVTTQTADRGTKVFFCGIATADTTLFDVLDHLDRREPQSGLAEVIDYLRQYGAARVADIAPAHWQEVRTDAGRSAGERLLLEALRKPATDGLVASLINRRFSLALTRMLMRSRVRPNHITAVTFFVSVLGALVGASATATAPWWLGVGALLWQLASMLDGTDGELARLRFQSSRLGEWLDTLTDDTGRVLVFLGLGYGAANVTADPFWWHVALASVAMQVMVNITIYRKLLVAGAGSHFALGWTAPRATTAPPNPLKKLFARIQFISRRDSYIFCFMCLCLVGWFKAAFLLTFIVTGCITLHEILRPRQARGQIVGSAIAVVSGGQRS